LGEPIHVVSAVDEHYLGLVDVVAGSIAANTPSRDVVYHVLLQQPNTSGLSQARRHFRNLTFDCRPVVSAFPRERRVDHVSAATMLRLQIPDAFPELERVVYLDPDLVVARDLTALYTIDLHGRPIGGVIDYVLWADLVGRAARGDTELVDHLERLGIPADRPRYINAGVLLLDLVALRKERLVERAAAILEEFGQSLRWRDQDIINMLFLDRIQYLDPVWNVLAPIAAHAAHGGGAPWEQDVRRQCQAPAIIHFAGPMKPWVNETAFSQLWWRYAPRTGTYWRIKAVKAIVTKGRRVYRLLPEWMKHLLRPLIKAVTARAP
jgi:lipopolysaccharide biosynthesis glycosyltransferase